MTRNHRLACVAASLALAGLLAQCGGEDSASSSGEIGLPERAPPDSAVDDSGDGGDGGDAASRICDPATPFDAPILVAGLDSKDSYMGPRLSKDELTIYFTVMVAQDGSADAELATAVRAKRDMPFGPAVFLTALNTPQSDTDPMIASDGLSLWFASARSGTNKIYVARRAKVTDPLGAPVLVPELAGPADDLQPYYRVAGPDIWFVSRRADSGSRDVYFAAKQDASFGTPTIVNELTSVNADTYPAVTEDGLGVFLATNRDGGPGGFDLWGGRRASTAVPFGALTPIPNINTPADEFGGWVSPDGCRVYFSSNRDSATPAQQRLWYAARSK